MARQLFAARDGIKENIKNSEFLKGQIEKIKADAAILAAEQIRALSRTDFNIFYETGSRKEYEYEYFHHRRRLNDFAVLSLFNDDSLKYLHAAIEAILDEETWAVPAHIPRGARTTIDLFAAETAFTLAEISALYSDKLSGQLLRRIETEVRARVIEPYLTGTYGWETNNNNWAAVCAGSVGAAILYLASDKEIQSALPRIKRAMTCYLDGFGDDGACVEGLNYWNYGFGYYTYFAQLLYEYSGENLLDTAKARSIAQFPQRIQLKNNRTVNFSDCTDDFFHRRGLACFLAEHYDGVTVPNADSALDFDGDTCYRFASLIRDFAWGKDVQANTDSANDFDYFKDAQWYIKRTAVYDFASKAGHNDDSHNHNDIAAFMLNVNGKGIVADSGRGEYTKDYFGDRRYDHFPPSALAHSVPIINGTLQSAGRERQGEIIAVSEKELVIDFEMAYEDKTLKKLRRRFELSDNKITMRDTFSFTADPQDITEHFVFWTCPEKCAEGLNVGGVLIKFDTERFDCSIEEKRFAADYDIYRTVYLADLNYRYPQRDTEVTIEFIMGN